MPMCIPVLQVSAKVHRRRTFMIHLRPIGSWYHTDCLADSPVPLWPRHKRANRLQWAREGGGGRGCGRDLHRSTRGVRWNPRCQALTPHHARIPVAWSPLWHCLAFVLPAPMCTPTSWACDAVTPFDSTYEAPRRVGPPSRRQSPARRESSAFRTIELFCSKS